MAAKERNSEVILKGLEVGESRKIVVTAGDIQAKGIMKKTGERVLATVADVQLIETSFELTDDLEGEEKSSESST